MGVFPKTIAVLAMALLIRSTAAAPVDSTGNVIPVKISIPDSSEVISTDVPSHSAIPKCLRDSSGVTEDENGLNAPAAVFTDCARKELNRLQQDIKSEAIQPVNDITVDDTKGDAEEGHLRGTSASVVPEELPYDENEEEESPEYDGHIKEEVSPKSAAPKKVPEEVPPRGPSSAPAVPDLTSVTNAFDSVKPISKNPGVLGEVVRILQVIFDYKRIQSDLQRILNGDLHKVLQEYPDRAAGFFKLIVELPERFKGGAQDVGKVKQQSKSDGPYSDVFEKLHLYMNSAARTSQELPNMLSLVSTVDTLRNIATHLTTLVNPSAYGPVRTAQPPTSEPAVLLREITSMFQVIPDAFGSFFGRRPGVPQFHPVHPAVQPEVQRPVEEPVQPGTVEAKSVDAPRTVYQDLATVSLGAVDAVSKTLYGILTRDANDSFKEQEGHGSTE